MLQTANRKNVGFIPIFARVLGIIAGLIILLSATSLAWFVYYSGDLPNLKGLARYAPNQVSRVSDPCIAGDSIAIPYDAIGDNLLAALNAAEGNERSGHAGYPVQISRTMFCADSKALDRQLKEWRVSVQLKRRYSRNELLTIYANRVSFGENLIGVEAASEQYFRKQPNQLEIAEAALLAGMLKGPSRFSPIKHADRALQRRNEVIDAMVESHAISTEQGATAKASDLSIPR